MTGSLRRATPIIAATASLIASALPAQQTRAERTGGMETSSYADVIGFLDSLARAGAPIRIGRLGTSPEGRAIPYVIAARPMVDEPGDAHRSGKPIVYLQGNIHSGEVEGKEAAQMLLRDLTLGPLVRLLDSVIVLVVPIYNTDGNERLGPGDETRPGQNGPPVVATSTNGQGLNLNRDYVKLEAPETRGAYALLERWDPDVFIDLHTTNGSYHGYALTWSPGLNPNSGPANDYARDRLLPAVRDRLKKRHRLETFPYGNFRNQEPDSLSQGWETYDPRPRFGTNAMGIRGRVPILSEGYSNNPFPERIRATYLFLREILSFAAEDRTALTRAVAASALWRPDSIALGAEFAPPTVQDVIAEITEAMGDGSHGFARRKRTGQFRAIRMPVFDRFAGVRRVARPAGYLIPPASRELVDRLRVQGVLVERLDAGWAGPVELFTIDSVSAAPTVFEGHRTVTVRGRWVSQDGRLTPGWYYVDTDQRLGTFASYLLEPASDDGYATWNLLDRDLAPGRAAPILRVRSPLKAEMTLVE